MGANNRGIIRVGGDFLSVKQDIRYLTSWSGGKDSALAFWRARCSGATPVGLLNMLAENGERSRSHGLPVAVLCAQAAALGVPMAFARADWANYERAWVNQARALAQDWNASYVVFGDIDLQAHRDWEEQVCAQANVQAWLPLWQASRMELLHELLQLGMRALIVSARADCADLLGETLSHAVIRSLTERGVDACGENGEYHTCVLDMPGFVAPLNLRLGEKAVSPEGYGFLRVDLLSAGGG